MKLTRVLMVMLLASVVWAQEAPKSAPPAQATPPAQSATPAQAVKPADAPSPAQKAQPAAKKEVPPDTKAFNDASAEKDPIKRIAALEKFIKDYPKHAAVVMARRQIIAAAVKAYPKERKKIQSIAKEQIKAVPPAQASQAYQAAASALLADNIQLDLARSFARQAVKSLNYETFAANARATAPVPTVRASAAAPQPAASASAAAPPPAANVSVAAPQPAAGASVAAPQPAANVSATAPPLTANRPAPTEQQLRSRFNTQVAGAWVTLAQVEFKANNYKASEKAYQSAIALDSSQKTAAALNLALINEKRNKLPVAFEYATTARLSRASRDSQQAFERIYKETHNGSANGSEEYLDAVYAKQFPPPLLLEPYKKSDKRTGRVVLAEVHTGAGCPPCVAADLAFDAMMERYTRNDLVVLMYHQHIPRPDPMTNPDTLDRWKFVGGRGVPTYIIDGRLDSGGGGRDATANVEARIRKLIEPRLEIPAEARLAVLAVRQGNQVKVETDVSELSKPEDLVLRVALTEKMVRYSGENGVRFHPMVVRSLASFPIKQNGKTETVFDLDQIAGKIEKHIADFEKHDDRHNLDGAFRFIDYPLHVNADDLAVVVYLENEKSKAVLQAAQTEVGR